VTSIGTIELQGIRAIGRHGVLPEEQKRAQPFELDVRLALDLTAAAASDRLEDTVDYGLLAEAVVRTVELSNHQLLESLADRIAKMCLGSGPVLSAEVTVRKLRPPVPFHISTVAVTVTRTAVELDPDDLPSVDVGVDLDAVDQPLQELDAPGSSDVGPEADAPLG
jgi:dihydroneopterin aldolase